MTKYYDKVAETGYDGLFAGAEPSADVFSVTIAHGATAKTLGRGTILSKNETGVEIDGGGDAVEVTKKVAYAILADDVAVGTASDVVATAYRSGHFVRQLVKNEDGSGVTAEQEDSLRLYGILLSDAANA
jgi:hypothetical protein